MFYPYNLNESVLLTWTLYTVGYTTTVCDKCNTRIGFYKHESKLGCPLLKCCYCENIFRLKFIVK